MRSAEWVRLLTDTDLPFMARDALERGLKCLSEMENTHGAVAFPADYRAQQASDDVWPYWQPAVLDSPPAVWHSESAPMLAARIATQVQYLRSWAITHSDAAENSRLGAAKRHRAAAVEITAMADELDGFLDTLPTAWATAGPRDARPVIQPIRLRSA